jgi:hypothetical protein
MFNRQDGFLICGATDGTELLARCGADEKPAFGLRLPVDVGCITLPL